MDPTFRNYNSQQASSYAAHRTSYTPSLYSEILKYHSGTNSNAEFDVLLDVGCGPGTATRDLAMYFNHAIGIDPSPEMIARAKSAGGQTKTGNEIGYELLQAENLASSKILKPASVDILTAGMAVSIIGLYPHEMLITKDIQQATDSSCIGALVRHV